MAGPQQLGQSKCYLIDLQLPSAGLPLVFRTYLAGLP